MALPPKLCPECGEEYLHTASVCVHCEVPLVLEAEPEAPPEALPPASDLTRLRGASAAWAVGLSDRLRDAQIPHRVEAESGTGPGSAYGLYVRAEDVAAARRVEADYVRQQVPDAQVEDASEAPAGDACPACGATAAAVASECPECGLYLGEDGSG